MQGLVQGLADEHGAVAGGAGERWMEGQCLDSRRPGLAGVAMPLLTAMFKLCLGVLMPPGPSLYSQPGL